MHLSLSFFGKFFHFNSYMTKPDNKQSYNQNKKANKCSETKKL